MTDQKPTAESGGIKDSLMKILLGGTGGGAGVAIVYFAYDLLRSSPELFGKLLEAWGPGFVYVLAFLWIGHGYVKQQSRFAEQHLAVGRDSAAATGQQAEALRGLSSAVAQMAEKDDRRAIATEAAVGFVAQQNEKILATLGEIKERLPQ